MSNEEPVYRTDQGTKRPREEDEAVHAPVAVAVEQQQTKKASQPWFHPQVPNSAHYHVSWMHADVVTHVTHAPQQGVVITASRDGVVKFWKRQTVSVTDEPLEFVKAITAHAAPMVKLTTGRSVGGGNEVAASVDETGHVQFYDGTSRRTSATIRAC